jgi:hypothetical protein
MPCASRAALLLELPEKHAENIAEAGEAARAEHFLQC